MGSHLPAEDIIRDKIESLETKAALQRDALALELQKERDARAAAEARVKHIEQALKAAARVLTPYLAGARR